MSHLFEEHVLALLMLSAVAMSACGRATLHNIVPIPGTFETGEGVFVLDRSTAIALSDPSDDEARKVVELWAAPVRAGTERRRTSDTAGTTSTATASGTVASTRRTRSATSWPTRRRAT
jgi:hypothetical protein